MKRISTAISDKIDEIDQVELCYASSKLFEAYRFSLGVNLSDSIIEYVLKSLGEMSVSQNEEIGEAIAESIMLIMRTVAG